MSSSIVSAQDAEWSGPGPQSAPASSASESEKAAQASPPAATGAPASSAAPTPPSTAVPAPPSGPPPQYYVEPQAGPSRPPAPQAPPETYYYEPPPPPLVFVEPPPPPEPAHHVPRSAFWAGARLGWLAPFGSLWVDGFNYGNGVYFRRRSFADYASSGPSVELNVGARLSHRYNVFGLWEHASLGTGSLDGNSYGGQERGATNLYGVGLRFSTDPTSVGFLMEIALGYRDFRAYWSDGTKLSMYDGWLDARLGLGVDIRLGRAFSLSPMFTLAGGSFSSGRWSGTPGDHSVFTTLDDNGGYGFVGFQLGGHVDIY